MQTQNYKNHGRYVLWYSFILLALILVILAGSTWNFYRAYDHRSGRLSAALIFALALTTIFFYIYARRFALRAQDRAIRAEENLRYFAITGNLLDSKLTMSQIIALRFAPNNELLDLAHRAVEENLKPSDIKKAIQNWKADHNRV